VHEVGSQGEAREAIATLSEKEQMVISLYYKEELTMKEIAEVMQLGESRISQIHSLALSKLRATSRTRLCRKRWRERSGAGTNVLFRHPARRSNRSGETGGEVRQSDMLEEVLAASFTHSHRGMRVEGEWYCDTNALSSGQGEDRGIAGFSEPAGKSARFAGSHGMLLLSRGILTRAT